MDVAVATMPTEGLELRRLVIGNSLVGVVAQRAPDVSAGQQVKLKSRPGRGRLEQGAEHPRHVLVSSRLWAQFQAEAHSVAVDEHLLVLQPGAVRQPVREGLFGVVRIGLKDLGLRGPPGAQPVPELLRLEHLVQVVDQGARSGLGLGHQGSPGESGSGASGERGPGDAGATGTVTTGLPGGATKTGLRGAGRTRSICQRPMSATM